MQEINIELLQYLNNLSQYSFIDKFVKIFVDGPILLIPIFLLWYWIYYSYTKNKIDVFEKKSDLILIFIWIVIWLSISLIIQQIVHINRPEQHLQAWAKLLLDHLPDASFPSDHATVSIAFVFWLLFAWYKKYFWIFLVLMIFMNISRVIAWVHWPFDILWWSIVWFSWAFVSFKYLKKIKLVKNLNLKIIKLLNYIKL